MSISISISSFSVLAMDSGVSWRMKLRSGRDEERVKWWGTRVVSQSKKNYFGTTNRANIKRTSSPPFNPSHPYLISSCLSSCLNFSTNTQQSIDIRTRTTRTLTIWLLMSSNSVARCSSLSFGHVLIFSSMHSASSKPNVLWGVALLLQKDTYFSFSEASPLSGKGCVSWYDWGVGPCCESVGGK